MKVTPENFVMAARVPEHIKTGSFGLWTVTRIPVVGPISRGYVGFPWFTVLQRYTEATMMHTAGETVMEDSATELRKHLPIWLCAAGRVLVTGLGLGCVVRGLLASERVEHVDCLEIDQRLISHIGPEFAAESRVTIHHADATDGAWPGQRQWDYGWHDLWSEHDNDAVLSFEAVKTFCDNVDVQGIWQCPRWAKRLARSNGSRWIG